MTKPETDWRRSILALSFVLSAGSAAAQTPNMAGSLTMSVWSVQHEGETWAQFRFSGGSYTPTDANATSTRGTILSHPYFRASIPEAAELAAGLRAWLNQNHNITVYQVQAGEMGMSFTGNDGITWGPEYEPVVVVTCRYWLLAGERGEMHGEMYVPLPVPQVEALATALETLATNPSTSARAPLYQMAVN